MNKAYPDIFCQWLLQQLQDHHNFTLLADKNILVHCKHNIKINNCYLPGSGTFLTVDLDGVNITSLLPPKMKEICLDLYLDVRKIYLDFYEKSDKMRRDEVLNKFVFNNLINY